MAKWAQFLHLHLEGGKRRHRHKDDADPAVARGSALPSGDGWACGGGNRLREPLPSLIAEGLDALLAYLRSLTAPPPAPATHQARTARADTRAAYHPHA